jgi:hypothetical protein
MMSCTSWSSTGPTRRGTSTSTCVKGSPWGGAVLQLDLPASRRRRPQGEIFTNASVESVIFLPMPCGRGCGWSRPQSVDLTFTANRSWILLLALTGGP